MRVLKSIHPLSLPLRAFLKTEEGPIHDARVIAIGVFDDGNGGLPDAVPLTLDPNGVWIDVRTLDGFTGFDTMTKHAGIAADYLEMAKERFPQQSKPPVDPTAYRLQHFHSPTFSPTAEGWTFLEDGHNDARCTGGAWYFKGNKELALAELAKRKVEQKKAADAYYASPWV